MYPAFCKYIVHVSNCVSKVAQIYKNLPQNKCKINVVTLTVLLIVKEASCEAYEHKKKLLTSVKTSAGTPLAIKIVQSCFNKPAKERFTTH